MKKPAPVGFRAKLSAWLDKRRLIRQRNSELAGLSNSARALLTDPCGQCQGQMRHLPGRDSGSTGEAMFQCKDCGHQEHRGGWLSEWFFEPIR